MSASKSYPSVHMGRASVHRKPRISTGDKVFYTIAYTTLTFFALLVLYPLIYILSASFSSPSAVSAGKVVLLPVEPSLRGYTEVFSYGPLLTGYRNTIFYTVVGTAINISMTMCAAFGLTRKNVPGVRVLTFMFMFTMLFSGGLIPTYLLMKDLNFINKIWVMLIPGAISVQNMIIARTFIQTSIPAELNDAATIDGCTEFTYFFKILLPLSKTIIAVLTLYYAVGHWNSYFSAMIYLRNKKLFPLQIVLREILILNQIDLSMLDPEMEEQFRGMEDLLKYSLIVISTVPIMCVYPFVQKYFVKGVMIGSLKG